MKDRRIHRIMSLCLALALCFSSTQMVSAEGETNVAEVVYDNYGREPILPIEGELDIASTDYYYEEKNDSLPGLHGGLDIICAKNTKIMAVFDGVVKQTQEGYSGGYGVNVIIEHTDANGERFYSRYAHLTSFNVNVGDKVSQGQVIGLSGSTGQSYTYHLHLEIYNSSDPTNVERSYTTKYLLSLPVSELARMSFYYHPINGEYNSQQRQYRLGSGGSCYSRCGKDEMHDHISNYARYLEKFYNRSQYSWNCRYYFDSNAELGLFSDSVLRDYVYNKCDTNNDGHLSYVEVMRVRTLDLRGLNITSLDGLDIFENLTAVDNDNAHRLVVEYKIDSAYVNDAGLLGLWEHIDDDGELPLRKQPIRNNDYAGAGIPYLGRFVVTESCENDGRVWGKTTYNGVEGWVIIGNSAWTRQLTSGEGAYTIDADGRLIYTASGMRVQSVFDSTMTIRGLLGEDAFGFISSGENFYAWRYANTFLTDKNTLWIDIVPYLSTGDASITLTAVMMGDPSIPDNSTPSVPVYKLDATYKIPEHAVADAGYAGLWAHTDLDSKLRLRSGHATSYGTVGYIDPDVRFLVTEFYVGSDYLWGKTTYNGVSGWCALDSDWAEQITSGVGAYTVDSQGNLIYTSTGEKVITSLNSTAKIYDLLDISLVDCMREGFSIVGWMADGKYSSDKNASLVELIPSLEIGDVRLTLVARIKGVAGDADGNGVVNEQDLEALVRYLSGYDDSLVLENLDADGNGRINTRDFIHLREMIG